MLWRNKKGGDCRPSKIWICIQLIKNISDEVWKQYKFDNTNLICLSDCVSVCFSQFENKISVKRFISLKFLNVRQSVELPGWGINMMQGSYLNRITQTQNTCRQTTMSWVALGPTITAFKRVKTFNALDHMIIVIR
jgi:hypothetical protein